MKEIAYIKFLNSLLHKRKFRTNEHRTACIDVNDSLNSTSFYLSLWFQLSRKFIQVTLVTDHCHGLHIFLCLCGSLCGAEKAIFFYKIKKNRITFLFTWKILQNICILSWLQLASIDYAKLKQNVQTAICVITVHSLT